MIITNCHEVRQSKNNTCLSLVSSPLAGKTNTLDSKDSVKKNRKALKANAMHDAKFPGEDKHFQGKQERR